MKIYLYVTMVTLFFTSTILSYSYTFFNGTPDNLTIEINLVACAENPLRKSVAAHQHATLETSHWYSSGCLMKSITLYKNGARVFNRTFGAESGALTLTQGDKTYQIKKTGDTYTLEGDAIY